MIPGMRGMNDKRMNSMMKRMGISVNELNGVEEVIIVLRDKKLVFKSPSVTIMNTQGQKMYQVTGEPVEATKDAETSSGGLFIPKEDIDMVMSQAGCSEAEARAALEETEGDIAEAIIKIMGG